jgi:hypothetical protein
VGEAAGDVVLPSHEIPGLELGVEGEGLATLGAETGRAAGAITLAAPDLGAAVGAEPLVLGDHGFCITAVAASIAGTVDDGQASAQTGRASAGSTTRPPVAWCRSGGPGPSRIAVEDNRLLATERVEPIGDGSAADSEGSSAAVPQTSQ